MAEEVPEDQLADIEAQLMAPDEEEMGEDEAPVEIAEEAVEGGDIAEQEEDDVDGREDDEDFEGFDVDKNLKDAVEGSLRLKRLLSRDEDVGAPLKKRKGEAQEECDTVEFKAKVHALLTKWDLQQDAVCKHVLGTLKLQELEDLIKAPWRPDKFNQWKSPPELLAKYTNEMKERGMISGYAIDVVMAFKFRWKLSPEDEKLVRGLDHKTLRYVMETYDGTKPMQEVIEEAADYEPEEENAQNSLLPDDPGPSTMGRFHRLELIDPLADCAVFGDANLTFALRLAKHRKALGHVGRVIATTFEELGTLRERYKEIDESIQILEDHFCEVYHGVDCTRIAIDPRFKDVEGSLGAVYYNFPHSGAIAGFFDGHPCVNWRHENLMRLFFRALRSYVKPGGIVKVASNMSAVGVRYSYIVGGALENEFIHTETVPFLEWHLHRYGRSYGDRRDVYKRPDAQNNQSYNSQRGDADMVYCFCYRPSGNPIGKQHVRLPPTLKTLAACNDGPFNGMPQGPARTNLAKTLHKRFVMEISGTHVG